MLQLDSINFYKIGMTFQKMLKMDCGSRCQLSPLAQHIAAHQLGWIEEDPVDAWPAECNDGADQEGSRGSPFLRGPLFLVGRERLLAEHHGMCQQLTQLQKLHLDISEFRLRWWFWGRWPKSIPKCYTMYAGLVARSTFKCSCSWMRELDEMWLAQLPGSTLAWMFGMRFSRAMITWLHDQTNPLERMRSNISCQMRGHTERG